MSMQYIANQYDDTGGCNGHAGNEGSVMGGTFNQGRSGAVGIGLIEPASRYRLIVNQLAML
jgi:hypothetical protein